MKLFPLWLHYTQPAIKSLSPICEVCNLNEMLDCNHCNLCLHRVLSLSDGWCLGFWSTFALPLCIRFTLRVSQLQDGVSCNNLRLHHIHTKKNFWRQVADLEMKLHQNDYIDIHLKLLVFSFRILLPCSCVPTSWTRKTFLASRTPSWFSIGVMRTEREWVHSGWTHTTTSVFDLLLHTAMPQKLYQYVEL